MKSFEGYLKRKLGDDYVLLAGGGHYLVSNFFNSGKNFISGTLKFTRNLFNALFSFESPAGGARSILLTLEWHFNSSVGCKTFHITTSLSGGITIREFYSKDFSTGLITIRVGSNDDYYRNTRVDVKCNGSYDGDVLYSAILLCAGSITSVSTLNVTELPYTKTYTPSNVENTTVSNANSVPWTGISSKPEAIGSANKPIYWNGSTFVEANSYPTNFDTLYITDVGVGTGNNTNKLYYTKNGSSSYFTVPYASSSASANYANYLVNYNTLIKTDGVQFIQGQLIIGTQAVEGNGTDTTKLQYPSTAYINSVNNTVNMADIRVWWSSSIWRDFFMSPNDDIIYTRGTNGDNTWRGIVQVDINSSKNLALGSSTKPVYVNSDGRLVECSSYPTKESWNYDDTYVKSISWTDDTTNHPRTLMYKIGTSKTYIDLDYAANSAFLEGNSTLTYGSDGLQYYSGTVTQQNVANANSSPTGGWHYFIRMNHGNSAGYYGELAFPINAFYSGNNNGGIYYRNVNAGIVHGWWHILDSNNSSVSLNDLTLTVKIDGTSLSLTNTWRGIQDNLTSDSTTDSLSAAQGKALNNKFADYQLKLSSTLGARNLLTGTSMEEKTYTYPSSSYSDKLSWETTTQLDGDVYTLSFWAKSTVAGDRLTCHFYSPNTTTIVKVMGGSGYGASDGNSEVTLTTSWKKYWITFYLSATNAKKSVICPRMWSGYGSGTVSIKGIMFEEGSIAHDWSPAPEDLLFKTDISDWAKASSKPSYSWSEISNKPLSGDTGNNGPVWGNYVPVKEDGVMEVGRIIDFHHTSNDGVDYAVRLRTLGNSLVEVNLPTSTGTLALTSLIPTVNNASLYLLANSSTVKTFTSNASSDVTLDIKTGTSDGTISVGGTDVSVKSLGTAAYRAENYFFKESRDWVAFDCTLNYNLWNRVLQVDHGGLAGQSYLISIETHYNSTVCCVTFHVTATLSGGVTITEWRAPLHSDCIKIRITSNSNYYYTSYIDLLTKSSYDNGSGTYYVKCIALLKNTSFTVLALLNNVSALSYNTEAEMGKTVWPGKSLNSSTADLANTIKTTDKSTHPSSGSESYYIPMVSTKSGSGTIYGSSDFFMWRDSSSNYLNIGNSGITSGITFHRVGETSGAYGNLISAACTDIRTWILPNKTGTIALTSDLPSTMAWSSITSRPSDAGDATTPVYWSSNTAVACTSVPWSFISDKPGLLTSGTHFLEFEASVAYNQWNRVATITSLDSGQGSTFFITIATHHNATVSQCTFLVTATYGGRTSISELSNKHMNAVSIRVGTNTGSYPGTIYVDLKSNSTYTGNGTTYRIHILGLMCNTITKDNVVNVSANSNSVEATSHTDGAFTSIGYMYASGFSKSGSTSSKVLLGDGSDKDLSDFILHKEFSSNSIDDQSGSFFFGGDNYYKSGYDYVGLLAGNSSDKWQLIAIDQLKWRQNDNGGTNTSWGNWYTLLDSNNYSSYALPISGGNMTGNIGYTGSKATYTMIQFIDNTSDTYGNGIAIGGGGLTIIGGGESASAAATAIGGGGSEQMIVCNDGSIEFYSNVLNGWSSKKSFTMSTDGEMYINGNKVWHAGNHQMVNPGTASSLTSLDITKTFIYVTLSANVAASAFTLSSAMSTGQCLTVLVYNSGSATISITVPSSWKSLDGYNLTCGATKFLEISIVKYASGANDYILSSKAQ